MRRKIKKIEPPDCFHLDAAEGWLGLGNHHEAQEELERISPELRAHPNVLEMRWKVHAAAGQWEQAAGTARELTIQLPEDSSGWIHQAYSLHELKRTQEAWDVLHPQADQFPKQYLIRYNLACYACQLGDLKMALDLLKKAMKLAGKKVIRAMALQDPDLKPLWNQIGNI